MKGLKKWKTNEYEIRLENQKGNKKKWEVSRNKDV